MTTGSCTHDLTHRVAVGKGAVLALAPTACISMVDERSLWIGLRGQGIWL